MEPLLDITEVALAELGDALLGRDLTAAPDQPPTYAINARGWALGRDDTVTAVRFVHDANVLWEVPLEVDRPDVGDSFPTVPGAEHSGFYATLSALPLPPEFELNVRALAGEEIELGTIRGRRSPLAPAPPGPGMRPLMLTGFSRTGSNLVLRMLGSHPEVIAYRPFQYEPRVLAYWCDVFRELTEPAAYLRQITTQGALGERGWSLGIRTPMPRPLFDPAVQRSLALDTVADTVNFARKRIAGAYDQIALATQRPDAALFAEKVLPDATPTIAWELYPDSKEVFLVRDFRDMLASVLDWKARFGGRWFGHADAPSDEAFVLSFERFVTNLLCSWRRRAGRAQLLRYEDVIRAPGDAVESLVSYLELDSSERILARMADSVAERSSESESYRTTASSEASIGRWRADLPPLLQPLAEEVFGPALEEFGYEPGDR